MKEKRVAIGTVGADCATPGAIDSGTGADEARGRVGRVGRDTRGTDSMFVETAN